MDVDGYRVVVRREKAERKKGSEEDLFLWDDAGFAQQPRITTLVPDQANQDEAVLIKVIPGENF